MKIQLGFRSSSIHVSDKFYTSFEGEKSSMLRTSPCSASLASESLPQSFSTSSRVYGNAEMLPQCNDIVSRGSHFGLGRYVYGKRVLDSPR